jgi:hypothetical protein
MRQAECVQLLTTSECLKGRDQSDYERLIRPVRCAVDLVVQVGELSTRKEQRIPHWRYHPGVLPDDAAVITGVTLVEEKEERSVA